MATSEKFDDEELIVRGLDGLVVTGGVRRNRAYVTVAWHGGGSIIFGGSFEERHALDLELALNKVRRWFDQQRRQRGAGYVER